mmetsp:Transcript_8990/g.22259  ORF Transcript_8990/g.22259 Transcript_8990/m.22259 type:complete len:188 (-) Transcript_8990:1313-1876(-)
MSPALCKRASIAKTMLGVLALVLLHLRDERGGTSPLMAQAFYPAAPTQSLASSLSCICVDCQWVTSCKAYHFVETKHEQPHMSKDPTFLPREGSPTIQVNIRTEPRKSEPGSSPRMWKDHLEEEQDEPKKDASYYEETGTIETVKTNTTTTIEYDIVKCADFVLDKGCWVRNMPEEIRRVNPDFVPT